MPSEKILISMKGYIGDAVMALPLVDQLIERSVAPTILASGVVDQVLAGTGRAFHTDPKAKSLLAMLRLARDLRRFKFPNAILINQSFRSALVLKLAGIPNRIGYATEGRRILLTSYPEMPTDEFQARSYLRLGEAFGVDVRKDHPAIRLDPDDVHLDRTLATVGVQPGARYESKRLPYSVTASVIQSLQRNGARVALFGGPDERETGDEILKLVSDVDDWIGKLTIRQTLSRLAQLKLAFGADTGAMHLAAAVNCPTVTVFGPTDHQKWGHDYLPHRILVAPEGMMANVQAETIFHSCLQSIGDRRVTLA